MLADVRSIHNRTQFLWHVPLLSKHIFYFHIKGGTQAILKPVSEIQAQVLCTIMGCFVCILTSCNETKEVLEGKFTGHFSYITDPSFIMSVAEER
jgi:hypothetical protein